MIAYTRTSCLTKTFIRFSHDISDLFLNCDAYYVLVVGVATVFCVRCQLHYSPHRSSCVINLHLFTILVRDLACTHRLVLLFFRNNIPRISSSMSCALCESHLISSVDAMGAGDSAHISIVAAAENLL